MKIALQLVNSHMSGVVDMIAQMSTFEANCSLFNVSRPLECELPVCFCMWWNSIPVRSNYHMVGSDWMCRLSRIDVG